MQTEVFESQQGVGAGTETASSYLVSLYLQGEVGVWAGGGGGGGVGGWWWRVVRVGWGGVGKESCISNLEQSRHGYQRILILAEQSCFASVA